MIKFTVAVIFSAVQFLLLDAQYLMEDSRDSLLQYFIDNQTTYDDSAPTPSATDFKDTRVSFPWLYHDQQQWENLSAYLDDPYFKDIHDPMLRLVSSFAFSYSKG